MLRSWLTLELLTVIRVSYNVFPRCRARSHATYHGCALPTELRWLSVYRPQFGNCVHDSITKFCIRKIKNSLLKMFVCTRIARPLNCDEQFAEVAQLAEQWYRKPQVAGSIPALGSKSFK